MSEKINEFLIYAFSSWNNISFHFFFFFFWWRYDMSPSHLLFFGFDELAAWGLKDFCGQLFIWADALIREGEDQFLPTHKNSEQ